MGETERILMEALSEITGLTAEDLESIRTLDLFENGVLDSLSLASLLGRMESALGKKIDLAAHAVEDFQTIDALLTLLSA